MSQALATMKLIIVPVVAIFIATGCNALGRLPNARFLGMGYNIIRGNPDDNYKDPGFLFSILDFTWSKGSTSSDGKYEVPDHVQALQIKSCGFHSQTTTVRGTQSYQQSLSEEVKTDVKVGFPLLASASYSGSEAYNEVKQGTSSNYRVYTIVKAKCIEYELAVNYGAASIRATDEFERAVNALPLLDDKESQIAYNNFIETFGSHFTSRVMLGAKMVARTEFEEEAWTKMEQSSTNIKHAAELSIGLAGHGGSVSYETNETRQQRESFESSRSSSTKYYRGSHPPSDGSWETWSKFAGQSPAPISYTLTPLLYVISERFFPHMPTDNLTFRLTLLHAAYERYCSTVPGCEPPSQDRMPSRMINATANFRLSPSRLSCPANYNLLSCGIKNSIYVDVREIDKPCDPRRYAIPDDNNGCMCNDKHGSNCIAWCTAAKVKFAIANSSDSQVPTKVYCPTEPREHKVLTLNCNNCALFNITC